MLDSVPSPNPESLQLQEIVETISQTGQFKFHQGVSLEWWYLTGFLWNESECESFGANAFVNEIRPSLGFQTTYFAGTVQQQDSQSTRIKADSTKPNLLGLVAHAAFSQLDKKTHSSSTRYAQLPLVSQTETKESSATLGSTKFAHIASVTADVFHVNIADWKLSQIARKPAQFMGTQTVGNLRLNFHAQAVSNDRESQKVQKSEFLWLQGQNGIVEKLDGRKNAYITIPFLKVSAHVTEMLAPTAFKPSEEKTTHPSAINAGPIKSSTERSQTMCGTAWLDNETGVSLNKETGWVWLSLKTPDHKAFMVYKLEGKNGKTKDFVAYRDPSGKKFTGSLQNWNETAQACIGDPKICYPQKISFTAAFQELGNYRFTAESFFEDQEVEGPDFQIHSRYWEGAVHFSYNSNETQGKGLGYMEIVKPSP